MLGELKVTQIGFLILISKYPYIFQIQIYGMFQMTAKWLLLEYPEELLNKNSAYFQEEIQTKNVTTQTPRTPHERYVLGTVLLRK